MVNSVALRTWVAEFGADISAAVCVVFPVVTTHQTLGRDGTAVAGGWNVVCQHACNKRQYSHDHPYKSKPEN